ncbi:hypothetical protein C5167_018157 [Papaver somniferum]|uniref:Uncharacterized protein n=1 Tax=Papaver somniferum TaxID=3469 RepID=A0A4Y7ILY9_PAPSO|nr:hypothetical protein C5167_018157 [Papaver somniferum]
MIAAIRGNSYHLSRMVAVIVAVRTIDPVMEVEGDPDFSKKDVTASQPLVIPEVNAPNPTHHRSPLTEDEKMPASVWGFLSLRLSRHFLLVSTAINTSATHSSTLLDVKVSSFILPASYSWDVFALQQYFSPSQVQTTTSIRLSNAGHDTLRWSLTNSGDFTLKS